MDGDDVGDACDGSPDNMLVVSNTSSSSDLVCSAENLNDMTVLDNQLTLSLDNNFAFENIGVDSVSINLSRISLNVDLDQSTQGVNPNNDIYDMYLSIGEDELLGDWDSENNKFILIYQMRI